MHALTAKRTLVKSPPELWSELSELERLARHLGAFGEIAITKLEPEHTVAWEGEAASGTVSIEPSGWGTKVTLTAQLEGAEPAEEPSAEVPIEAARRRGFMAWLFRARTSSQETLEEPQGIEEPSQDPSALDPEHAQSVLDETLEALGSAHHRPFSRG